MNLYILKLGVRWLKYCFLTIVAVYLFMGIFKYSKAKNTKKNLEKIEIGMSTDQVTSVLGRPDYIQKDRYYYRTNFNPIYPMQTVLRMDAGIVDTIYTMED